MMWFRFSLGVVASLGLSLAAFAASPSDIRAKLTIGEFAEALAEAKQTPTAEGQALGAEILLTEIMIGKAKKNKKQAKRAREMALNALEIDPSHQNARLQHAIADGFVTRETGDVSAWMKKLPQKTHAIVQAYRDDFPNDPRGDALLGAWHLAIARKAGDENAIKWFDASIDQGRALFLAARAEQPNDAVIALNYAFSLLALDEKDFPDTEEARLTALSKIEDRDAVRKYVGKFLDGKVPAF